MKAQRLAIMPAAMHDHLQAGDYFYGFAEQNADNVAGAAGDVKVRVRTQGAFELPIAGLAITDIGAAVYASDDDTFTLTATSNTYIGRFPAL